jgi:hypothetical protein
MASSVQFRGIDEVLTAFDNIKCPAWSILQGGQFMFKHAGKTEDEAGQALRQTLEMLEGSSNSIYTLRVYEDITERSKLKANTAYDGSFNFRLNMESQELTQAEYRRHGSLTAMQSELSAVKAQLAAMQEEEEDDDETDTEKTLGEIGSLINNPVVMQLAQMIFGVKPKELPTPGALAGVNEQEPKIKAAVEILKLHDTRLGDHLEKLATIAQTAKPSFDFLLNTLDSM